MVISNMLIRQNNMDDNLKLNEFIDKEDVKWVLDNTVKINLSCNNVFESFFAINEIQMNEMPDYMCVPIQCEILRNYRFRYRVVEDDNGVKYLRMIRQLDSAGHKTHFAFSYPILPSIKGHSTTHIRDMWRKVGVDKETLIGANDKIINSNFYNTREDAKRITSSKYKSKHGINKMISLVEVHDSFDKPELVIGFNELFRKWYELKGGTGIKNELKVTDINNPNVFRHRIYVYDGKVIGYTGLGRFHNSWFALIGKHAAQIEGYITDAFVRSRIGYFLEYDTHKMLLDDTNDNGIFAFGDVRSKTLRSYKNMIYKNTVDYSRIDI